MDVFTFRQKLTIFAVLFVALSVIGFLISRAASDPNLPLGSVPKVPMGAYGVISIFTILVPAIAYGFLGNASAKRLLDMGKSKFLAIALGIPLVNFALIALLALSFESKPSGE